MRAIEIYNSFFGYSPEAHRWAIEYGCAICSGTDAHNPLFLDIDYLHGKHRPVTLIFARERTTIAIYGLDNKKPIGLERFEMNFTVENFLTAPSTPLRRSIGFVMPRND